MTTLNEIVSKVITKQQLKGHVSNESLFSSVIGGAALMGNIAQIYKTYQSAKNDKAVKLADNALDAAAGKGETSLTEFTKSANHYPRVVIEETLRLNPIVSKMMMGLVNIYAAYYLQAVALAGTVNRVSVVKVLDRFNPDVNGGEDLKQQLKNIAIEAINDLSQCAYVLPNYKSSVSKESLNYIRNLSLEAPMSQNVYEKIKENAHKEFEKKEIDKYNKKIDEAVNGKPTPEEAKASVKDIKDALRKINDMDNLAVGRLLNVDVTVEGVRVEIPMAIRVRPMSVPSIIMGELVAFGDIRESMTERWHRFKAGEIDFGEWLFMTDVIKERRKLLAKDKSGIYKDVLARRRNAKAYMAANGKPSLGTASSFMIISQATARNAELRYGVGLDSDAFRERMFKENAAMMICVVDPEWESITVYTRGIKGSSKLTFKEFEGLGKGNGVDVQDVMKAFMAGNRPSF